MKLLKNKAISFLVTFFILSISLLIYTLLLYKEKINSNPTNIYRTSLIIGAIIFFIYGLLTGILERKKGLLSSIISTLLIISIIIIIKLISKSTISSTDFIKYLIYLLSASLGGIIGVNLAPKKIKNC